MRKLLLSFFVYLLYSNIVIATTYYSIGSNDVTVTNNWKSNRDGTGTSPTNFTSGDIFIIQNGHSMTTSDTLFISGTGSKLWIENGGTLTATSAITLASATTFQIDDGGTYVHSNTTAFGSSIFHGTESFSANSTVEFRDWNSTGPNVSPWGNIKFNATGTVTAAIQFASSLTTINGNFDIIATGSGTIREVRLSATSSYILNIAGNFNISGGALHMMSGSPGSPVDATINIGGNFNMTGGTFTAGSSININANLNFTGLNKTYTQSSGTFTNTRINFTVNSGAILTLNNNLSVNTDRTLTVNGTLNCGTNIISGNGAFVLSSGATIGIGSADGINTDGNTGNIQTANGRNFSTGANYTYNGSVAQTTGNAFPTSAFTGILTIGNTVGLSLSANFSLTTSGKVIVNGFLNLGSNIISSSGLTTGGFFTYSGSTIKITNSNGLGSSITVLSSAVTFDNNTSYEFSATTTPFFSSLTSVTCNNFKMNGNITLNKPLNVNGNFDFGSGKMTLGNNDLIIAKGNNILNSTSSKYFVTTDAGTGKLTINDIGNSDIIFPIGTSSTYNPITINNTSGPLDNFSVNVKTTFSYAPTDPNKCVTREWNISEGTTGSNTVTMKMQFNSGEWGSSFNTGDSIVIGHNVSGIWSEVNATISGSNPYVVTASGITSFSPYAVGNQGALPITLLSFNYICFQRNVKLTWVTTSENNNSGFEIERAEVSSEQLVYSKIAFVSGKGNSNVSTNYEFNDSKLNTGKYKYRLKQIDNNGNYEYFDLDGVVEIGVPTKYSLSQNYPNPFNPITKIDFDIPIDSKVSIKVFDVTGREVKTLVNEFRTAGYYTVQFDGSAFSSGVYFYRIQTGDNKFVITKKMLLVK